MGVNQHWSIPGDGLPQSLSTDSSPQFERIGLSTAPANSFIINSVGFKVANSGAISTADSLTVSGTATVYGSTTLNGATTINNTTTMSGTVSVFGSASVSGAVSITGNTLINGAVTINETGADLDTRIEAVGEPNAFFVDASTNRVGLGTSTPDAEFTVERDSAVILYVKAFGNSAGIRPGYISARARGTRSSASAVQTGDFLGEFTFRGHDGTQMVGSTRAGFRCRAAEDWTSTDNGTEFDFTTTPEGSVFPFMRLVITSRGWFGFGNMTTAEVLAPIHVIPQSLDANTPLVIFDMAFISDVNEVVRNYGNTRIGVGANDRAYYSYWLDNGNSDRFEYARQYWVAETITAGAEVGAFRFDVAIGGTLTTMARFGSSIILGSGSLATTATNGFVYIPGGAGAPSGTPDSYSGRHPMYVDTTNERLYVYVNGAWKYSALV